MSVCFQPLYPPVSPSPSKVHPSLPNLWGPLSVHLSPPPPPVLLSLVSVSPSPFACPFAPPPSPAAPQMSSSGSRAPGQRSPPLACPAASPFLQRGPNQAVRRASPPGPGSQSRPRGASSSLYLLSVSVSLGLSLHLSPGWAWLVSITLPFPSRPFAPLSPLPWWPVQGLVCPRPLGNPDTTPLGSQTGEGRRWRKAG